MISPVAGLYTLGPKKASPRVKKTVPKLWNPNLDKAIMTPFA